MNKSKRGKEGRIFFYRRYFGVPERAHIDRSLTCPRQVFGNTIFPNFPGGVVTLYQTLDGILASSADSSFALCSEQHIQSFLHIYSSLRAQSYCRLWRGHLVESHGSVPV